MTSTAEEKAFLFVADAAIPRVAEIILEMTPPRPAALNFAALDAVSCETACATRPSAGRRVYKVREARRTGADRPGKDGVTHTHTTVLKTQRSEINTDDYLAREILSDGSRMPALTLRPMLENLARELDLRVESIVERMITEALRNGAFRPNGF
jgi:hypothetical protein